MSRHRMVWRKLGLARTLCAVILVCISSLIGSCAGETTGGGTDSNTHWLDTCDSDSDCGSLACVCGICTRRCSDVGACTGLPGAVCISSADCSRHEEGNLCQAQCAGDNECLQLGADFRCREGLCRASSGGFGGSAGNGGAGGSAGNSGTGGSMSGGRSSGGGGGALAGSGAPGGDAGSLSQGGTTSVVDCGTAMRVGNTGPCTSTSTTRYYWAGGWCMPFVCESCTGADCDSLFATAEACDIAYGACYDATGLKRECEIDSDCSLAVRGCCGTCGTIDEPHLLGIRADAQDIYRTEVCGLTPCAGCVSVLDPNVFATCVEGRCAVSRMAE